MHPTVETHDRANSLAYMISIRLAALAIIALAALLLLLGPQLGAALGSLARP